MTQDQRKFEEDMRNLRGTFAVEGITLSESTVRNLERIAQGSASYETILREIKEKYRRNPS